MNFKFPKMLIACVLLSPKNYASQVSENEKQILKATVSYLIEAGRLDEAKMATSKFLKKYPNEIEVLRLGSLISYVTKNYRHAAAGFKTVSMRTYGNQEAINFYLLIQSLIQLKDYQAAEEELKTMRQIPCAEQYATTALAQFQKNKTIPQLKEEMLIPDKVEKEIEEAEEVIPKKVIVTKVASKKIEVVTPVRTVKTDFPYSWSVTTVIGSDTNPIFLPDNSSSRETSRSTFYSLMSDASYRSQFFDGEMSNDLSLGYTNYQKEEAKVFNNLRFSLLTKWHPEQEFFKENKVWLSNKLDRSYQTNKAISYYYTSEALSINKDLPTIEGHSFTSSFFGGSRFYGNKELTAPENDRTGKFFGLKMIHKTGIHDWGWLNSISYAKQNTEGKKFNTNALDFVTSYQKVIPYDIEALVSAGYSLINYPQFTTSRKDRALSLGVDLEQALRWEKGLVGKLSYSKVKNSSTVSESTYTQDVISLWVTYEIF